MSDNEPSQTPVAGDPLGLKPGEIFWNKYRVLGVIGKGGVSTVYRAENVENKQLVAIKVLHAHKARDEELVRRFVREAQTTTKLEHPHAIRVYEWGIDQNERPFMIIEYLNGETLSKRIQRGNGLNCQKAVEIMEQICAAVSEAHAIGIIHRDLKPDNIMLTTHNGMEDYVKVVDFGIAKLETSADDPGAVAQAALTRQGAILGTPLYMSPEQLRGRKADARSDVYALGVIMYEMLTGKPPFTSKNTAEVVVGHLNNMPDSPAKVRMDLNIPGPLSEVVLRALAKDPWQRPTTVQEFSNSLIKSLGKTEQKAQPAPHTPAAKTPTPQGMSVDPMRRVCPNCLSVASGSNFRYCLKCGNDNTNNWLPYVANQKDASPLAKIKALPIFRGVKFRRLALFVILGGLLGFALNAYLNIPIDLTGKYVGMLDHELFNMSQGLPQAVAKKVRISRVDAILTQNGDYVDGILITRLGQHSVKGTVSHPSPMIVTYELVSEWTGLGGKIELDFYGTYDKILRSEDWTVKALFLGGNAKPVADLARMKLVKAKN